MQNVTDRTSNPFGMAPPCEYDCEGGQAAVFGYGDANADFHVVGDHPGLHGGSETGVPFTGSRAGDALQDVFAEVGLLPDGSLLGDEDGGESDAGHEPTVENCFLSYLHACCTPGGRTPTAAEYDALERFFDAELRAIAAHVLLPVGERATRHVLGTYTARLHLLDGTGEGLDEADSSDPMADLHGEHVPGRGFLVVPIREPSEWESGDRERLRDSLADLLASDYRQTADLGRFLATDDTYEVR